MLPLRDSEQSFGISLDIEIKSPHDDERSCFGYFCNYSFKLKIILFENQVVLVFLSFRTIPFSFYGLPPLVQQLMDSFVFLVFLEGQRLLRNE